MRCRRNEKELREGKEGGSKMRGSWEREIGRTTEVGETALEMDGI